MSHVRNLLYSPGRHTAEPAHTPAPSYAAPAAGPQPVAVPVPIPVREEPPTEFPVEEAQIRPESRLVYHTDPRSPAADRFRFLRMRLREFANAGKLKKLLVTSPIAGDGKSTAILNLATALAERGKRKVLVVEADLHRGSIAEVLRLRAWSGLGECLTGDLESPLAGIRRIEPLGWYLLPAGEPRGNPTEMLQTAAIGGVMEKLTQAFDWILIDSPPVTCLTDAISLQQHADGTLLVVRAGHTPRETLEQTIQLLGQKKIAGVLLNAVEVSPSRYDQRYYDVTRRDG
jgi:capsular exopolysaccharide synthesis family protein